MAAATLGPDAVVPSYAGSAFPTRRWHDRIPCSACGRMIRTGVVAANASTPPEHALCAPCFAALMEDPRRFAEAHPL